MPKVVYCIGYLTADDANNTWDADSERTIEDRQSFVRRRVRESLSGSSLSALSMWFECGWNSPPMCEERALCPRLTHGQCHCCRSMLAGEDDAHTEQDVHIEHGDAEPWRLVGIMKRWARMPAFRVRTRARFVPSHAICVVRHFRRRPFSSTARLLLRRRQ